MLKVEQGDAGAGISGLFQVGMLCSHAGKTHFCPCRPFWGLEGTQVMGTNQDSYGLHKAGVSIRKHQVPEKGEAATLN